MCMNPSAMFKISYGLYVLTAKNEKDNGCIINTAMQITSTPNRIIVMQNKGNYTHDMIQQTRQFNISMLSQDCTFDVLKQFGFQTGKNVDKFACFTDCKRSENGLFYITKGTNAFLSANVSDVIDCGTHSMFLADVVDGEILSSVPSVTYDYYQSHIKPAPEATKKSGYRCKICGYVYEGEVLPPDYICPVCKHGAADFEKI